jgi:hypothetical protein
MLRILIPRGSRAATTGDFYERASRLPHFFGSIVSVLVLSAGIMQPASAQTVKTIDTIDSAQATERSTLTGPVLLKLSDSTTDSKSRVRPDTLSDSLHDKVVEPVPDSGWRWLPDPRTRACAAPLETPDGCWRTVPDIAVQETGFPGLRATALNLHGLERAETRPFFQAGLAQSPYAVGGHLPFQEYETRIDGSARSESWTPVQPLDTPVTDLHWMRGALLLNQFGMNLHRMVGNRAYLGFDYFSNGAVSQFYDYAFNVHQPYLGFGRDSLSLVIQDTSHSISSRQMRTRLGYWVDARTVVEAYADWFDNSSSLTNPTNAAANDSLQWLFPAEFHSTTYGGVLARSGDAHTLTLSYRHAAWERNLEPRGDVRYFENATGTLDLFDAAWTVRSLPGAPRIAVRVENETQEGALWLEGVGDSSAVSSGARGDRESITFDARPAAGLFENVQLDLRGEAARRALPNGVTEMLGGGDAEARVFLPWGFRFNGSAGWNREGAPEEFLFRWQPAQGFYPNPDLAPRTHARYGAGAGWDSRHLGIGAEWERHRFENTWLRRVLPDQDACILLGDSLGYPGESAFCSGPVVPPASNNSSLPDSLALARVNYAEETRDLVHLSGYLALGNWKLTLRNTYRLANAIRDPRLGFTAVNWEIPQNVLKGQLLWKRRVLDGKLGLQTRWDWEWFSQRQVFASDMDGTSRLLTLDEYLALDFNTQMEIKSFILYFRAMNLTHDRYATEAGVHPPGVNFRFGVDWRLRN